MRSFRPARHHIVNSKYDFWDSECRLLQNLPKYSGGIAPPPPTNFLKPTTTSHEVSPSTMMRGRDASNSSNIGAAMRRRRNSLTSSNKWTLLQVVFGLILFLLADCDRVGSFSIEDSIRQHRSIDLKSKSLLLKPNISKVHHPTSLSLLQLPLIDSSDSWGNIAILTGNAAISQVWGQTTRIGRLLGGPVTAMALTFLLASIGVLAPGGTAASKSLQILSLQLATPLILLGADLRDCVSRCGPLLVSFFVASMATIIACLVGWSVSGKLLMKALGQQDGLIIAAALMAKNIGGGINYIAVSRALSASPQAIAAGLCIDNIFALIYFPATSAIGSGRPDVADVSSSDEKKVLMSNEASSVTIRSVSTVLFVASILLWMGERIGGVTGALPCCTLLTVIFASWAPSQWVTPLQYTAEVLGTSCLYLFFATAGAPGLAVADSVRASLIPLTLFLTCLYSIHGVLLWICHGFGGKLGKNVATAFVPQRLLVASSAAIGGPATSVALAQANGWKSLMVPSLLVGNIGYAIATFCGLAYFSLLR